MTIADLLNLPLSAYTPGMGDPSMEGGFETASGAPMHTLESFLRGSAPYVTGATSMRNPSGALVNRNIGNQNVPVKITDYGPGVKGLDIATENKAWATNFPHQGQRDHLGSSLAAYDALGSMNRPAPTAAPAQQYAFGRGGSGQMSSVFDYGQALGQQQQANQFGSAISSIFSGLGQSVAQQGQQGMQQAMQMMQRPSPGAAFLQSLLNPGI